MEASLSIESASYNSRNQIAGLIIKNNSDVRFLLKNKSEYTFTNNDDLVVVPAQGSKYLEVKTVKRLNMLQLDFIVINALSAPKEHAKISLATRIKN